MVEQKGAYQVGAFRALKEYEITISGVSGTSIGGINGFAYATMSVDVINKLWDDFTFEDFLHLIVIGLMGYQTGQDFVAF